MKDDQGAAREGPCTNSRPPLIAIVGGVASGKSFVSGYLKQQGAAVVSADELAHEVLKFDEVRQAIRDRWGEAVFSAAGEVDRPKVAQVVFAPAPDGPRERAWLEQRTHPQIGQLIRQRIAEFQADPTVTAIILDVPLLVESGKYQDCDKILFVDAPREIREARAVARGWSPDEFARREAAQKSLEEKKSKADIVIDNSDSPESVAKQIKSIWPQLIARTH